MQFIFITGLWCFDDPGEITEPNYLRINNTNLSPDAAAQQIIERLQLC